MHNFLKIQSLKDLNDFPVTQVLFLLIGSTLLREGYIPPKESEEQSRKLIEDENTDT